MNNELEKFFAGNREAFDDKVPPANIWDKIDGELTGKHKNNKRLALVIKWSMGIAAMLLIGSMFYYKLNEKDAVTKSAIASDKTEVPGIPQVNEFARMILLKQEELKTIAKEQPGLYQKFTTDIIQLDSSYKALKDQLSISPNKELLVEAMIQNLELQLSVLNQQLSIIKQIKQSKEYSHEKSFPEI